MASRPSYGEGTLLRGRACPRVQRRQGRSDAKCPNPASYHCRPTPGYTVFSSNHTVLPPSAPSLPQSRATLWTIHSPPPPRPPGPLGSASRVLGSSSASSWTSTCSRPSSSSTRRLTIPEPCLTAFAISSVVSRAASSITSSATPQPSSNLSRNARPADAESGRPGIWASATCGSVFPPFMTSLLSRWATQPQRARPSDGGDCDASVPDPWRYETRAAYTRQDTTS